MNDEKFNMPHPFPLDHSLRVKKDYLAGVYRPWDCELKDWVDDTTIAYRFENCDLLVWMEGGFMRCATEALDLDDVAASVPGSVKSSLDPNACICWVSDAGFSDMIGNEMNILPFRSR